MSLFTNNLTKKKHQYREEVSDTEVGLPKKPEPPEAVDDP